MKAILGRLTDLGVKELFKLLTSAGATGELEIESAGARATLQIRNGYVSGEPAAALVHAVATRSGTFCFRPGPAPEGGEWFGVEEFLARVDALISQGEGDGGAALGDGGVQGAIDPLAELRHSLAEVPLAGVEPRLLVVATDPRHYRVLEPEWRQRGWDVLVHPQVAWPEAHVPNAMILHLPTSATLAGQGDAWVELVRRAASESPAVPAIWVGGLADPLLRHQAVQAGVEFLLPAPAGDVGESARWFREDLTAVVERVLARRESGVLREAAAFRDFFLALHSDATPAEVRASLLRFAGNFFARAVLVAVRDGGFDSLGGFGLVAASPARLPRGLPALEHVVVERKPARSSDLPAADAAGLCGAVRFAAEEGEFQLLPLLRGGECVAILIGHAPLPEGIETQSLASLLSRSGSLLGL